MHPKSPQQDRPTPWSENAVLCISSRHSRLAIISLAFAYLLISFSVPSSTASQHRIITHANAEDMPKVKQQQEETLKLGAPLTKKERVERRAKANITMMGSYLQFRSPVLTPKQISDTKQVHIRFLMGNKPWTQSQHLVEGIERSAVLTLVSISLHSHGQYTTFSTMETFENDDIPIVYMVDVESLELDCHVIERLIQHAKQTRDNDTLPEALVLMDDSGSTRRLHCPNLQTIIPPERIRMTRRNVVQNRYWDSTEEWVHVGQVSPNDGNDISGGPIVFSPFCVRDSFVYGLTIALKRTSPTNIPSSIVNLKRERDVAHFWNQDDSSHYSSLRNKVNAIVQSLDGEYSNGRKLHTVTKILGQMEDTEHGIIDYAYVEQMVRTKIVVVAQRDEWEGHLRLMEALASGAMVIADKTLAMPSGLIHKTSIVFYDSANALKEAILYYLDPKNDKERLSIAQRGWEVVMGRHRSWHRVEEVIFGKPQSQVDQPWEPTPKRQARLIPKKNAAEFARVFGSSAAGATAEARKAM